jgi:hypothetical protein
MCCPLAVHIAPTVPIRERRLPYCDWGGQRELGTWEAGTPVCFRYDKIVCWRQDAVRPFVHCSRCCLIIARGGGTWICGDHSQRHTRLSRSPARKATWETRSTKCQQTWQLLYVCM